MLTYFLIALFIGFALIFFFKNPSGKNYNDLSISELREIIKKKNTILIDVRTPRETRHGMIGNPLEIELGSGMKQKLNSLDKEKKYVVYCRSGHRSMAASNMMVKLGFKDVNNLLGGYLAWQSIN